MRVFVTVEEEGGFAAASRKLDISPAAVTRAIVALEELLGVKLIQRTTRNIRLTDAGHQYYEDSKAILTSLALANEAVSGANAEPHGTLTVTASVLFGRLYVMPSIIAYMQKYPKVKVIAHFVDRVTNLVEEGIDVAIRIGELPDSSLRANKVGQVRHVFCASPAYLEKHGVPQQPEDLRTHAIISANALSTKIEWRFGTAETSEKLRMEPKLIVSSNDAALAAAIGGLGITRLLSYQVKSEVERGALTLILEEFEEPPWPIHVVHREDKLGSSKVRAFIDGIVHDLRNHPNLK
ncbi:MAG: LysR family transcriptional regulator [Methylophilus sp.]|uniref:LysR family transcriptional regulator n=1 Tax=Methylophilus sp. TaxID=29541 RepID=UPI003F9F2B51